MSNKTNEEIIAFIKSLPPDYAEEAKHQEAEQRIKAFAKSGSDDDAIAYLLANRMLLLKQPFGLVWAPPRWLPRLKRMARRLGAKTEVDGSKWAFSLPGMEIMNEDFICFGRPANNADLIMPFFVFQRRPDVEREAGFSLAGTLVIDIPPRKIRKQQPMLNEVAENLVDMSKDGRMGDNELTIGWPHPTPAYDDEIMADHELMNAWAKDKPVIFVRVGEDPHDLLDLDSDMLLCMGLGRDGRLLQ
jgi:hypothetical protein